VEGKEFAVTGETGGMTREAIICEFLDSLPGKSFRFPDEPRWMSGDEIEASRGRLDDYVRGFSLGLCERLGVDPEDHDAMMNLLAEVLRIKKSRRTTT
jgi:hypothetical protein